MKYLLAFIIPVFGLSAIEVTAENLVKDFKDNILHFKKKYEEKSVTVKGEAGGVSDYGDNFALYIHFKSDTLTGFGDPIILCILANDSLDKASTLRKKQSVKVQGTISYKKDSMVDSITINNCEIQ